MHKWVFLATLILCGCTGVGGVSGTGDARLASQRGECVILLHGLIRTERSMLEIERALEEAGFATVNDGYPSRSGAIAELTDVAIPPAVEDCRASGASRISFVSHSLGGILVRYFLERNEVPELGRVVMLSPPNHGSEIVDYVRNIPGFELFSGPAGVQLGTGHDSVPRQLGPADFEVGVITGEINGFFSALLPGQDDGKVSVESSKLPGMADFMVVETGHMFIMADDGVIRQAIHFLETGRFSAEDI